MAHRTPTASTSNGISRRGGHRHISSQGLHKYGRTTRSYDRDIQQQSDTMIPYQPLGNMRSVDSQYATRGIPVPEQNDDTSNAARHYNSWYRGQINGGQGPLGRKTVNRHHRRRDRSAIVVEGSGNTFHGNDPGGRLTWGQEHLNGEQSHTSEQPDQIRSGMSPERHFSSSVPIMTWQDGIPSEQRHNGGGNSDGLYNTEVRSLSDLEEGPSYGGEGNGHYVDQSHGQPQNPYAVTNAGWVLSSTGATGNSNDFSQGETYPDSDVAEKAPPGPIFTRQQSVGRIDVPVTDGFKYFQYVNTDTGQSPGYLPSSQFSRVSVPNTSFPSVQTFRTAPFCSFIEDQVRKHMPSNDLASPAPHSALSRMSTDQGGSVDESSIFKASALSTVCSALNSAPSLGCSEERVLFFCVRKSGNEPTCAHRNGTWTRQKITGAPRIPVDEVITSLEPYLSHKVDFALCSVVESLNRRDTIFGFCGRCLATELNLIRDTQQIEVRKSVKAVLCEHYGQEQARSGYREGQSNHVVQRTNWDENLEEVICAKYYSLLRKDPVEVDL